LQDFDYFAEMEGRIPFLRLSDRFYKSAHMLNMEIPLERELLKEKIGYLLKENKFGASGIKLLLTGGYSEDLYSPSTSNLMILNLPYFINRGFRGWETDPAGFLPSYPEVKTTFYLPSIIFPKRKTGARRCSIIIMGNLGNHPGQHLP
jgi:branched-subunit amino acid aminotransferase/4-amino-4-deoxychorismate lyase